MAALIKLHTTTRQALQVAVTISVIYLLGWFFGLERTYWAIFAAGAVLCQTWGDSLHKASERIGATLGGVVAGALLYGGLQHYPLIITIMIFVCLFLMAYFMSSSYVKAMFVMTTGVMLMFGLLGSFSMKLMFIRVYETFIGAAVAVVSAAVVFPLRPGRLVEKDIQAYFRKVKEAYKLLSDGVITSTSTDEMDTVVGDVFTTYQQLYSHFQARLRELYFLRQPLVELENRLVLLESLARSLLSINEIIYEPQTTEIVELLKDDLVKAQKLLLDNLDEVSMTFVSGVAPTLHCIEPLRMSIRDKVIHFLSVSAHYRKESMQFMPFLYYSWKINEALVLLGESYKRDADSINSLA